MTDIKQYIADFEQLAIRKDFDGAIEFLKDFPKGKKTAFVKAIAKLIKKGSEWERINTGKKNEYQYRQLKSNEYLKIMSLAGLRTYSLTDAKRYNLDEQILFHDKTEKLFDYYIPTWLTEWVNSFATDRWFIRNKYIELKTYQAKGYLGKLNNEIIGNALANIPSQCYTENKDYRKRKFSKTIFQNKIKDHFEVLRADLPIMFKVESGFGGYYDRTRNLWFEIIKEWCDAGLLNRKEIIQWTFSSFIYPFNRQAASVFRAFLDFLELTDKEKIENQDNYLEMLSNANPQHVSYALKEIKKIEKIEGFKHDTLVESLEPILVEDSKGMVKNALMLLERTAKKNKELIPAITKTTLLGLVSDDEDIQKRVLKLTQKYAPKDEEEFGEELMIYFENIKPTLRADFKPYLAENQSIAEEVEADFEPKIIYHLQEANQIEYVKNWDDWIYLASATYENGNAPVADIEQLLEGLVRLYPNKPKDILERLAPLVKRVTDTRDRHWETSHRIVGAFILTVHFMLSGRLKQFATIQKQFRSLFHKHEHSKDRTIQGIIFYRIELFFQLALKKQNLPVLSSPTHQNCWIDPEILVQRVLKYQAANVPIDAMDLSYAVARIAFEGTEKALTLAKEINGEIGEILQWILGGKLSELGYEKTKLFKTETVGQYVPREYVTVWLNALRTRFPKSDSEALWNYKEGKYQNAAKAEKYEWISERKQNQYKSGKTIHYYNYHNLELKSNQHTFKRNNQYDFLYSYTEEEHSYYVYSFKIKWLLSLLPNNPEIIFAYYNRRVGKSNSDYEDVTSNNSSRTLLQSMINFNVPLYEMGHLFIASAMSYVDKVSRGMAAEVAIHYLNQNQLNTVSIGKALGDLVKSGYGRIQRILPCLIQISEVSKHHGLAVKVILENMFLEFPTNDLPRNTKKLLELLKNLSLQYESPINTQPFQAQLDFWKTKSGLKKLLKEL